MIREIRYLSVVVLLLASSAAIGAAEDPVKWDKLHAREIKNYVRKLTSLAKWCNDKDLDSSAWTIRQIALRWAPEDKKLLEALGYRLDRNQKWRQDGTVRQQLRMGGDAVTDKLLRDRNRKLESARKSSTSKLMSLGKRALKAAAEGDAVAWRGRAERAWRTAVEIHPSFAAAHKALKSEEVDGRYILPKWVPAVKFRVAEREAGRRRAAVTFEVAEAATDPRLSSSGLKASGARSGQFCTQSQYGAAVAKNLALWCRRAVADLHEVYDLPDPLCGGTLYSVLSLQNKESFVKGLETGFGWGTKKATDKVEEGTVGLWPENNTWFDYNREDASGTKAYDAAIQSVVRWGLRTERWHRSPDGQGGREAWFGEAMALDVVFRLTGQALSTFVADSGYRDSVRGQPKMNQWQIIARRSVERDDDIAMTALFRMGLNSMKTRHTAKAYTFLQFLRETDEGLAQAYVAEMLVSDTPTAIRKVYGRSLEAMDEEYVIWVRSTYLLPGY
jgi:hypothetical protein